MSIATHKPLQFSVVTLFPQMVMAYFQEGLSGQAVKKALVEIETINPREFTSDIHKTVDDRPFGGGDGMVMLAEVLAQSIEKVKANHPDTYVVYLSAQGKRWSAKRAEEFAKKGHITLVSGRYGGVDQRFINEFVDEEISVGDYVLTGGELAAQIVIDSTIRFVPGVLGNQVSAEQDSFSRDGLEAPLFTRPENWRGQVVPEVLTGGHHKNIELWRADMGDLLTWFRRRDLTVDWESKRIKHLENVWLKLTAQEKTLLGLPDHEEFHSAGNGGLSRV